MFCISLSLTKGRVTAWRRGFVIHDERRPYCMISTAATSMVREIMMKGWGLTLIDV